jgi:hypothetical protein
LCPAPAKLLLAVAKLEVVDVQLFHHIASARTVLLQLGPVFPAKAKAAVCVPAPAKLTSSSIHLNFHCCPS